MRAYRFRHVPAVSRRCWERFREGRDLFPHDVLADVAERIRCSGSVSLSSAIEVLLSQRCDVAKIGAAIAHYRNRFRQEFGIEVIDRPILGLTPPEAAVAEEALKTTRPAFLRNVGVRGVICQDVETLINDLQKPDPRPWGHYHRAVAAMQLGRLGIKAQAALPALRIAQGDEHATVRAAATSAIRQIETSAPPE
jgi:hypothetical protein